MPQPATQPIPIRQQSQGGGGGGSGSLEMAVGNFINDQNSAQQKMMKNFSKLQEIQAMEAQQNAAQMTGAMNQVVAREDERLSRQESYQDKLGDRKYAEENQQWTAKFKEQATKDFVAVQNRVASQVNAARDFIQRADTERTEFGDRIRGMRQALYDPANVDQWLNVPGGMERLEEMTQELRRAEAFHEQDKHSEITGQVARKMAEVQEQILAGEPHEDLTKLLTTKPSDVVSKWTPEETEELYHTGGYPPGGIFGRDPEDPTLKKYKGFNPVEYMSTMKALEHEQFFALVHQQEFQDEYLTMNMEHARDMTEELGKLQEFSTKDYDRLSTTAVEGARYGVAGMIDELASGRLSPGNLTGSLTLKSGEFASPNAQHAMATKLLESAFTSIAGPGSEAFLQDLDALVSGEGDKGILDTEVEIYKGFNMRNVLRHIDDQLLSMTTAPEGQEPMSMTMAKAIVDMPPTREKGELLRSLVMVPGDIERGHLLEGIKYNAATGTVGPEVVGQVHRGINRMFRLAKQKANELRDVVEAQPVMNTYRMKQGSNARMVDALVASYMSDKPDADLDDESLRQRAQKNASRDQYRSAFEEVEGEEPEGFDIESETLRKAIKLSPLQAMGELYSGLVPQSEFLAALYSGDYDLAPVTFAGKGATSPEMEASLEVHLGKSKRTRERVKAEMRRRREAHAKKTGPGESEQTPAPAQGQAQPQGPPQPRGVPSL